MNEEAASQEAEPTSSDVPMEPDGEAPTIDAEAERIADEVLLGAADLPGDGWAVTERSGRALRERSAGTQSSVASGLAGPACTPVIDALTGTLPGLETARAHLLREFERSVADEAEEAQAILDQSQLTVQVVVMPSEAAASALRESFRQSFEPEQLQECLVAAYAPRGAEDDGDARVTVEAITATAVMTVPGSDGTRLELALDLFDRPVNVAIEYHVLSRGRVLVIETMFESNGDLLSDAQETLLRVLAARLIAAVEG